MAVQIQHRNDTAANWTSADPILAQGEMGIETDTNQFKVGNGSDIWSDLPYGGIEGPAGAQWRGVWNNTTEYFSHDIVSYANATWISNASTTIGDQPDISAFSWDVFVPAGTNGSDGADGVASATSPLSYNSETHVISLDYTALVIDGGTA